MVGSAKDREGNMVLRILGWLVAAGPMLAGTAQAQGKVEVLCASQAAFKMTTVNGKVILIDPWIMGATKIPPELKNLDAAIGKPDLVLVTHGHGDHLGDAVEIVEEGNIPTRCAGWPQPVHGHAGHPARQPRAAPGQGRYDRAVPGVRITMVHADHSSEMALKEPTSGKDTSYAAGEPCGFIIEFENGFKVWHMGDNPRAPRHEADLDVQARPDP